MSDWAETVARLGEEGTAAVLVTVALAKGSTPRPAGTHMVVTATGIHNTIGGGHLEFKAMAAARQMLGERTHRLVDVPLGPSLGQCCGGHTTLLLEPLPDSAESDRWHEALQALEALERPAVLVTAAEEGGTSRKMLVTAERTAGTLGEDGLTEQAAATARKMLGGSGTRTRLERPRDGLALVFEPVAPQDFTIVIYGAGHVGRALVRVLSGLPCRIDWIDGREDVFPSALPDNVRADISPAPEDDVNEAPAGSYFLVMTHSHSLDLQITEGILRRGDFRYFGLIGSRTKRQRFEQRLRRKGFGAEALARMTCPIGIPGITGKDPAEIAVAVAAEILRVREAAAAEPEAEAEGESLSA